MNLFLCGMMGSGKTTIGEILANALGWEWLDTDGIISNRYGDISYIFEKEGVTYFRDLEAKILSELAQKDRLVVSTGGGIVLKKENLSLMKESGEIIYLQARRETLEKRLLGDTARPLLQTGEPLGEKLEKLLTERGKIYEEIADFIVAVDEKTPDEIVREILA